MTIKRIITLAVLYLSVITVIAQDNEYKYYYPISEEPNIRYMSSYVKDDKILFEANPTLRYSFANNFYNGLINDSIHTRAYYVAFRPQLRMFVENSLPVKMASQRVLLGTQHLFRLSHNTDLKHARFLAVSLESGHYSNGQSRSSLSDDFADGSHESDSLYALITDDTDLSKIINRDGGNYSTNMTELIVQHRWILLDQDDKPWRWHFIQAGFVHFHDRFLYLLNFGGYTEQDIEIYGRMRYLLGYEWMRVLEKENGTRIAVNFNSEIIQGAHKSVNPFRGELTVSVYPFKRMNDVGFFISGIYGHDNYNLRFVDSGGQFTAGLKWSMWSPFAVVNESVR